MGTKGAKARLWDPIPMVSALPQHMKSAKEKAAVERTTWGQLGHLQPVLQHVHPPGLQGLSPELSLRTTVFKGLH